MSEQIDAHKLLDELREMLQTNVNVDWDTSDPNEEFQTLLEYVDRRRPVTDVYVAVSYHKGLVEDVMASKTDFEEFDHASHISKDEMHDESSDSGWRIFVTDLLE